MKKQIINVIIALLFVLMSMTVNATIGTMARCSSVCSGTEADSPISVNNYYGVSAINLALSNDASKVSATCTPVAYSSSAVLQVNPLLPTIVTSLVNTTSCQDVEFDADIAVTNFINVGSVSLALNYDTTKFTYNGYENLNSALEDGSLFVNARKGVVYVSWMSIAGATIGSGILMSLKFSGSAGSSSLTWYTSRCEYANVLGMVFPDSYQNGSVTIYAAPNITSQPSNKTVYEGSSTSISVSATGRTLSYQWQSRPDEGSLWTDLVNGGHYGNVTNSTLNIYNATLDMNGRQYRCVVSGQCEPEMVSNQAILTVRQLLPTIATSVGSLNTCSGTEFGIPVTVTNFNGVGALSLALQYNSNILTYTGYEWVNSHLGNGDLQVNASDGVVYITWMSVAGATIGNGTLLWINFTGVAGSSSLTWLSASCEYSNTEGYLFPTTFSNGSVIVQQENFEITSHPLDQDVIMGESTSFSVETEGQNLTYQWCVSADEGASWLALESGDLYGDVNTETLLLNETTFDMNGYLYRCEVNGSCGLKYSNPALLTVGLAEDFYQVIVTASPENGGEVTGEGVYYVGNSVTISATTNTGWHFVNWTMGGVEVSSNPTYSFTVTQSASYVAHFMASSTVTQTFTLSQGTNWFSAYVDISLDDLKAALVASAPNTAITIQSQTQNTTYNPNNNRWTGRLTSLDVAQMYMITLATACEIALESTPLNPIELPITITNGANWIAFPLSCGMSVVDAFAGFVVTGDIVQSQTQNANYRNGRWMGQLTTLEPGQGYIYKSSVQNDRTLIFPAVAK